MERLFSIIFHGNGFVLFWPKQDREMATIHCLSYIGTSRSLIMHDKRYASSSYYMFYGLKFPLMSHVNIGCIIWTLYD
jgi:hypothetical protein